MAPVEKSKAQDQSSADEVRSTVEFVSGDIRDNIEAEAPVISAFLDEYDINHIGTPRDFQLYLAEILEESGISVRSIEDVVMKARKRKSRSEIEALETVQSVTEESMDKARSLIQESTVVDGELHYEDELLTSERLRSILRDFLQARNCTLAESNEPIVSCGPQSADPHNRGSGSMRSDEPILIDIFPQHESGYWGDMTRTFVKGTPPEEFQRMYETTQKALNSALDVLSNGAGTTGREVHNTVCDVFKSAGYPTIQDGDVDKGFLHSTGHAIGMELHEPPRLVGDCGELNEGYVLTIEPGLYDDNYGGVRIEDMVVVTENEYENLNDFSTDYQL